MDLTTRAKLLNFNRDFYQTVAADFHETRKMGWQGWKQLFDYFKINKFQPRTVLDLGCGNGRFYKALQAKFPVQKYLGLDNNQYLITKAKQEFSKTNIAHFSESDIFAQNILASLPEKFELIVLFGVMHHLPDQQLRLKFFSNLASKLAVNGLLVFSLFRFLDNPQLLTWLISAEDAGFKPTDLDQGDYFLDWKRGKKAIRYCHNYSTEELEELLKTAHLRKKQRFFADGLNNHTNEYWILELA